MRRQRAAESKVIIRIDLNLNMLGLVLILI